MAFWASIDGVKKDSGERNDDDNDGGGIMHTQHIASIM